MPHKAIEGKRQKPKIYKSYRKAAECFWHTAKLKPLNTEADYNHRKSKAETHSKSITYGTYKIKAFY